MGRPSQCNVCCGPIVDPPPDPPIGDCGSAICIAFIDENTGNQGGQINITEKVNAWAAAYPDRLLFVLNVDNRIASLSFPPEFSQKDTFFLLRSNGPPASAPGTFNNQIERCNGDTAKGNGNDPWGKIVAMVNYYEANGRAGVLAKFNAGSEVSIFIDDSGSMNQRDIGQRKVGSEFQYFGTIKKLRDDILATGREIVSSIYNGSEDVFCPFVTANCCPTEDTNDITSLCGLGTPCTVANISFVQQPSNGLIREYCDNGSPECGPCVDAATEDEDQTVEYTARISNSQGVSLDHEVVNYSLEASDDNGQNWFLIQSLGSDFSNVEQSLNVVSEDECPYFFTSSELYELVGDRVQGQIFTEAEWNAYIATEPADPQAVAEQTNSTVKYALSEPMSSPQINNGQEFRFLDVVMVIGRYKTDGVGGTYRKNKILYAVHKSFRLFDDGSLEPFGPIFGTPLPCMGVEYDIYGGSQGISVPSWDFEAFVSIDAAAKPDPDGTFRAVAIGFTVQNSLAGQHPFVFFPERTLLAGGGSAIFETQPSNAEQAGFGRCVAFSKEEGGYPKQLVVGDIGKIIVYDISDAGFITNELGVSDYTSRREITTFGTSNVFVPNNPRSISVSPAFYDSEFDKYYYRIAVGCWSHRTNTSYAHLLLFKSQRKEGGLTPDTITLIGQYRDTEGGYRNNIFGRFVTIDNSENSVIQVSDYDEDNEKNRLLLFRYSNDVLTLIDSISDDDSFQYLAESFMSRENDNPATRIHIALTGFDASSRNYFETYESQNGQFSPTTAVNRISSAELQPRDGTALWGGFFPEGGATDKTASWVVYSASQTNVYDATFASYDPSRTPSIQSVRRNTSANVCGDFTLEQVNESCNRKIYNRLFRIKAVSNSDPSFVATSSSFQLFEWEVVSSTDDPIDPPSSDINFNGFYKFQSLDEAVNSDGNFVSNDTYSGAPDIPVTPEGEIWTLASSAEGKVHAVSICTNDDSRKVVVYWTSYGSHKVLAEIYPDPDHNPPNTRSSYGFGYSLALNRRGNYLYIGCPSTAREPSKVLVYKWNLDNFGDIFDTASEPVGQYELYDVIDVSTIGEELNKLFQFQGFGSSIDVLDASDSTGTEGSRWIAIGSILGECVRLFEYRPSETPKFLYIKGADTESGEAKPSTMGITNDWPYGNDRSNFAARVKIRPYENYNGDGTKPIIAVSAPGYYSPDPGRIVFIKHFGDQWRTVFKEINKDDIYNRFSGELEEVGNNAKIGSSICWIESTGFPNEQDPAVYNTLLFSVPGWDATKGQITTTYTGFQILVSFAEESNVPVLRILKGPGLHKNFAVGKFRFNLSQKPFYIRVAGAGGEIGDGYLTRGPSDDFFQKKNTDLKNIHIFADRQSLGNPNILYTPVLSGNYNAFGNDAGITDSTNTSSAQIERSFITIPLYPQTSYGPTFAAIGVEEDMEIPIYPSLRDGSPNPIGALSVYESNPEAHCLITASELAPANPTASEALGIKVKYKQSDTSTVDVRNLRFDRPPSTSTFIPANLIQEVELSLISDFNYPNGQINYTNWFISKNGGSFEDSGQSAQNPITIPIQPQDYFLVSAKSSSQDIPTFTLTCLEQPGLNQIATGVILLVNGATKFVFFNQSIEVAENAQVEIVRYAGDRCVGGGLTQEFYDVNGQGVTKGHTFTMNGDKTVRTRAYCVFA